jgi:hypothetical protein
VRQNGPGHLVLSQFSATPLTVTRFVAAFLAKRCAKPEKISLRNKTRDRLLVGRAMIWPIILRGKFRKALQRKSDENVFGPIFAPYLGAIFS